MSATKGELTLGAQPSIDLTPGDVKARRRGTGLRRALVVALVGAVVIVAAGYAAAFLRATAATTELSVAHARTEQLLAERQAFAEVIDVTRRSEEITRAREQLTATEVLWKPFIDELIKVFPTDAVLTSVSTQGRLPADAELVPAGPLRQPLVASITVAVQTTTLPDVAGWMRRVARLPGYADHAPTSVTFLDGKYTTTVSISLSEEALASRFGEQSPAEETEETATETTDEVQE
jgi:hypothetical protein